MGQTSFSDFHSVEHLRPLMCSNPPAAVDLESVPYFHRFSVAGTVIVATCRMAFRDHGSPNGATHRCFGYAQASGYPTGATYRCLSMPRRLDPQPGLRTGVWIPNRSYIQVFGFPTAATQVVGVPHRGYTRVFGVPNGRSCKLPEGFLLHACIELTTMPKPRFSKIFNMEASKTCKHKG